jgi:hypothetical protein
MNEKSTHKTEGNGNFLIVEIGETPILKQQIHPGEMIHWIVNHIKPKNGVLFSAKHTSTWVQMTFHVKYRYKLL